VRSVEKESTTRISSHQPSDSIQPAMFCSSLKVVRIAETEGRGGFVTVAAIRV